MSASIPQGELAEVEVHALEGDEPTGDPLSIEVLKLSDWHHKRYAADRTNRNRFVDTALLLIPRQLQHIRQRLG